MPQPYDYSTQQVNVGNYFDALKSGREEKSQMDDATRQTALQKYMPGALNGDAEAQQQAFANATPDQAVQLKQALMKMEDRDLQKNLEQQDKFARLAQWADTPEKWAQATQMAESEGLKGAAAIPFEQRGAKLAGMMSVKDQLEEEWKRRDFEIKTRETNASIGAKNAAADASRRSGQGGGGMTGRPMSAGVQGKEDEDIGDIQSIQSVNTQIDNVLGNLKSGDLELGPFANLGSRALNFAGTSTAGSRNFAEFEATLEKMRNDSLRLNKGVQTEGDAVRAWNEITKYITDPGVVRKQLERVKDLNALAAQQRLQRINIRRTRNGYGEFDPAEIGYGGGAQPVGEASPDDFSDVDALLGLK